MPQEIRDYVKKCVLQSIGTETMRPSTAAQCVAAIASVELALNVKLISTQIK
jgi:importin subunit beta-1